MPKVEFHIEGESRATIIINGRPATEKLDNHHFKTLLIPFGLHSQLIYMETDNPLTPKARVFIEEI